MTLGSEKNRRIRCQHHPSHPDTCCYLSHLYPLFSNTLYSMPVCPAHLSSPTSKPLYTWGPLSRIPFPCWLPGYNSSFLGSQTKSSRSFIRSLLPSYLRSDSYLWPHRPITTAASPVSACLLDSSVCWNLCLSCRWASVSFKNNEPWRQGVVLFLLYIQLPYPCAAHHWGCRGFRVCFEEHPVVGQAGFRSNKRKFLKQVCGNGYDVY